MNWRNENRIDSLAVKTGLNPIVKRIHDYRAGLALWPSWPHKTIEEPTNAGLSKRDWHVE
ncbi:MAG: hypothetical protein OXF08_03680 [Bacteroidetes bacterium]|nr:hypothetical protein [Bacteroidota bacterium]